MEGSTISAVRWVPRGAFSLKPSVVEIPEDEIQKAGEVDNFKEKEVKEEEMKEEGEIKKEDENLDDDELKEYNFDEYDNEKDIDLDDLKAKLILKDGIKEDSLYYKEGEKDPNMIGDESDSSMDDLELNNDDIELLAINNEDNVTTLQVWIYEELEDNLFLHHDILLSTFGLSIEWLNKKDKIGNFAAIGTFEPFIEIWDLDIIDPYEPVCVLGFDLNKKKKNKNSHEGAVLGLSWNKKFTNLLASCSEDKTIKIWDINEEKVIETIKHHKDKVASVCWHPEETNILLAGSFDGTISLFDPSKPTKFNSYKVPKDIESLKWNPHQKEQFGVSLEDGTVMLFDYRNTKKSLGSFKPHNSTCSDIAFHPLQNNILTTSGEDSMLYFWDISKSKCINIFN
eukprot:gene169-4415_t